MSAARLSQVKDFLTSNSKTLPSSIPWDPESTSFPLRKDLPTIEGAPTDAAWVWGEHDNIGRLNLLTPTRVKAAAAEIKTGEMVRLDLPLDEPKQPAFGRQMFEHKIVSIGNGVGFDDTYSLNTQSGSQWDGFRHFSHIASRTFYNNTKTDDIIGPNANHKCSVHHWSSHGLTGRALLIDYWTYAQSNSGKSYDPCTTHSITLTDLNNCAKSQGLDIRPASQGGDIQIGDILLIRTGFVSCYRHLSASEANKAALRGYGGHSGEQCWAGVAQSDEMLTWLHDCYFSAVGGDAPAFEAWPTQQSYYLHEYILALWGMPLGEMIDLEKVSEMCRQKGRWTFFFTSAPENCRGGVSTHPNATAIF